MRIWQAGLQHFDPLAPAKPVGEGKVVLYASVGNDEAPWVDPATELEVAENGYDLVMIQWCIGTPCSLFLTRRF